MEKKFKIWKKARKSILKIHKVLKNCKTWIQKKGKKDNIKKKKIWRDTDRGTEIK